MPSQIGQQQVILNQGSPRDTDMVKKFRLNSNFSIVEEIRWSVQSLAFLAHGL